MIVHSKASEPPRRVVLRRNVAWESIRSEPATFAAALACLALVSLAAPKMIVQDSWLTLVGGRLVATAGIPHRELLTLWAYGHRWTDQQWLADLSFYRAYGAGGIRAVVAVGVFLAGAAWVGAVALARRRGASGLVLLVWAPVTILVAPWALQVRAQSFGLPLFVCMLGLVLADARASSRTVFLALPLLVVWGNLHGTALLGAGIVGLHALATVRRGIVRSGMLAAGAVLALAANPYGFAIFSYYRLMTVNPPFASLVGEWKASVPSLQTLPFYALALVSAIVVFRRRKELTATHVAIGVALFAVAVDALRSITWFALYTLVVIPPLLRVRRMPGARFAAPVRAGALVAAVIVLGASAAEFPGAVTATQTRSWPQGAVTALRDAAAQDPTARVVADDRHADFVLWAAPQLAGRLVADVRFELLDRAQLNELVRFEHGPGPHEPANARIVVLDPRRQALRPWREHGWRVLYARPTIAVLEQPRRSA